MLVSPRYEGPTIITIAGASDDQLAPVTRQRKRLEALLADLDDSDWSAASRCDDWRVHDVAAHIVSVNDFWCASMLAGLAGEPTRVLTGFDPATTPALIIAPMHDLAPAALLERFVASNDAFLGILADLDDAGWSTLAETPVGHVPIRLLAHHALWDSWIHERDIALPLGSTPPVELDEVASCLRYAAALSPALAICAGQPLTGTFGVEANDLALRYVLDVGEAVALRNDVAALDAHSLDGDAVELVEAMSIRAPLPPSAPPEWQELLDGLATAFTAQR